MRYFSYCFSILFFLFSIQLHAQDQIQSDHLNFPKQSMSLNVLGSSSLASIEYEHLMFKKERFFGSAALGVGYNEELVICIFGNCNESPDPVLTIPHRFTYNLGRKSHFFEMGLGGTIHITKLDQPYLLYPIIGYRFQSYKTKRVLFRIFAQVPLFGLNENEVYFSPLGLSIGTAF